jgi:K+-transporting ATPase KdpF subunit
MNLSTAAFIGHMSGADFFGLVVSVLVCLYLVYALLRGEKF